MSQPILFVAASAVRRNRCSPCVQKARAPHGGPPTAPRGCAIACHRRRGANHLMLGKTTERLCRDDPRLLRSEICHSVLVENRHSLSSSSLGVTLAFKMKFWNIGAEGQLIMGAVFAT
ncbi:MAG: hypothetical protein ACLTB5_16010 [Acutalibacteraceae bacterium]